MKLLVILSLIGLCSCASAQSKYAVGGLYNGSTFEKLELPQALKDIEPGTIVIASEVHNSEAHHKNQVALLKQLKAQGLKVSVGMEFFDFTQQPVVNSFVANKIPEKEFLRQLKWSGVPFSFYREQVLFPRKSNGHTLAINAPRTLTSEISKNGLGSLSYEMKELLPPKFELGRESYRQRFALTMIDHVPEDAILRYFEAQSVWDDTMAYNSAKFIRKYPDQVLVILVGEYHAAYGGGLPDRLRARGISKLLVISQIDASQVDSLDKEVEPHHEWGNRADLIWVTPKN